ncbi:hypothetical protein [Marinobacter zhejiangensis]|nr:hypothetical protein [Marinobacter zhejiangensis]
MLRVVWPLVMPSLVFAHAGENHRREAAAPGLTLDAGISTTYRSGTAIPEDGVWQVPGILMGGDAHGADEAFNLDSANIHLLWVGPQGGYASLDVGSHHDGEVELEEARLGYKVADAWPVVLEGGRMKARFSPENLGHAYARPFSENNLVYDAFYGGHYADDGVRLKTLPLPGLELGIEAWRGDHYPATSGGDGMAQDAYIRWLAGSGVWQLEMGAWVMLADANERPDDRLVGGHAHGASADQNTDLVFSGNQDSAGARFSLARQEPGGWLFALTGEVVTVDVEGELKDTLRQAHLEGDYLGWWVQPELGWQRHALAVRYAQLTLDNHLVGAGGAILADEAGLMSTGTDPDWLGVSYRYQLRDGLGVRAEWTRNRSTGTEEEYIGLGIYWAQRLWSSSGG